MYELFGRKFFVYLWVSKSKHTLKLQNMNNTIILFYSQTGITKAVAEDMQKELGCDIAEIEAVESYGTDFDATIKRWQKELEEHTKVAIKPLDVDLAKYDTVFLGFPVWGGIYPPTVTTFLADNSLAGKKIVVFVTFGSGGLESSAAAVAAAQPEATVIPGYGLRDTRLKRAPEEIQRFLIEGGYIKGEIAPLPEFSASVPVDAATTEIFDKACGNYPFPLGTPVAVAERDIPTGKEYKFDVVTRSPEGVEGKVIIYVNVEGDAAPEFTKVVR